MKTIKRGDIYYADLSPAVGSEQGGTRPVLIVQNNIGNKHSPTVDCGCINFKIKTKVADTYNYQFRRRKYCYGFNCSTGAVENYR